MPTRPRTTSSRPPQPGPRPTARTRTRVPSPASTAPPPQNDLPLPHERDEATGATNRRPDPVIQQAKRDIERRLVDTDLRATPGLDAQRRDALVSGRDTEVHPAQVPVSRKHLPPARHMGRKQGG